MAYERLSAQDTAFLHIEDDHQPMHVGALGTLEAGPLTAPDGTVRIDDLRRRIDSRLHLVPRFRRRLAWVPLDQGRPVWVDDPEFDITYHVRLTALPSPGTEDQLLALFGRVQAQLLDRRRPLWELWFVQGLEGDRVALIQKTHHALIDGMSGIDVATVLFDLERDVTEVEPPPWEPEAVPDGASLLFEALVERLSEPAELARSVRAALRVPREAADRLSQVARAVTEGVARPPATPLNVPVTPHRRFRLGRVPLATAKAVKDAAGQGVTVNDVVLAACTGALRTFLEHRSGPVDPDLVLKAMVPVSVRSDDERLALGNRVSMVVAELPVGVDDPVERLRSVHDHMGAAKGSGSAVGADTLVNLTGFAPPTLLSLGARLVARNLPVNLVVTNVPGPQIPLYCMGARVLEAFPYVGVVDGLALIVALISYDGQLGFGISADRDALPDLSIVARGVEQAFEELALALGVGEAAAGTAPAKRAATERPAKKATAKKATAKKATAKKATAKKPAAKRATAEKRAARPSPSHEER